MNVRSGISVSCFHRYFTTDAEHFELFHVIAIIPCPVTPYNSQFILSEYDRSVATTLRVRWQGFHSRQGQDILLFSTASRPALGPTQPPNWGVPGGVKLTTQLHIVQRSRMVEL
jgi:hypothetical protein